MISIIINFLYILMEGCVEKLESRKVNSSPLYWINVTNGNKFRFKRLLNKICFHFNFNSMKENQNFEL